MCASPAMPEMAALADELGKAATGALGKGIAFAHCETAAEALKALRAHGVEGGDAGADAENRGEAAEAEPLQCGHELVQRGSCPRNPESPSRGALS